MPSWQLDHGHFIERFHRHLACPKCKQRLRKEASSYRCTSCPGEYPIVDDIPVLLDSTAMNSFKKDESCFHTRIAYQADEAHSLASLRVKYLHDDFLAPLKDEMGGSGLVLDVACGSGVDLIALGKEGYSMVGLDISYGMCKVTKQKLAVEALGRRAFVCQADAEAIPFSANSFDAAYISASLHHFEYPKRALAELRRVVRPNGVILIGSEPNHWQYVLKPLKHSKLGRRILRLLRNDYTINGGSPGDFCTSGFTRTELVTLLKETDFDVLSVRPIWYMNGLFSLLGVGVPRAFEELLVAVDEVIRKVPLAKEFSWKWNATVRNEK